MAIVTRFFGTAAAGAGDGSSWADRAELLPSGNWSTVITGFDFSGSDSLKCLIGPGTHTCGQTLASGLFANAPTVANPLFLYGCDGSGVLLTPPDPDWVSAQPAFDDSTLPVIATTTNIYTINLATVGLLLVKLTSTARIAAIINASLGLNWCVVENAAANTATRALNTIPTRNSVLKCTGSSYSTIAGGTPHVNSRFEGVPGSSGDRRGIDHGTAADGVLVLCTVVNCGGVGLIPGSNVSATISLFQCVVANNGGTGILGNATASQTDWHEIGRCMITGNGGYGIDAQSAALIRAAGNRLRDNTSGNFNGFGNYPTDTNNETTDAADSDDYVDAAGGDFRIKNTSPLWGLGYGVADEPARVRRGSPFMRGMVA